MIVQTFETIADKLGLSFICESVESANEVLDTFHRVCENLERGGDDSTRLPALLVVLPTSGQIIITDTGEAQDSPSAMVVLLDHMGFQARGVESIEIGERLKLLAVDVISAVNTSGAFAPITDRVSYRISYNDFDGNFCALYLDMPLRSLVGRCIDY